MEDQNRAHFCRLAGELYGAGDVLAAEHDRIEALAVPRALARYRPANRTCRRWLGWPEAGNSPDCAAPLGYFTSLGWR